MRRAVLAITAAAALATPALLAQHPGTCSTTAPTVTVTGVSIVPSGCPAENVCFKVDWSATPNGQTLTGFKVDLKVVANGQTKTGSAASVPGSARSAVVNIFMNGAVQTYDAKVTGNYSGCASSTKAGSL